MNKLKARILRTLKSLPIATHVVYPSSSSSSSSSSKQQQQQQQQQQQPPRNPHAPDDLYFDAPPSPNSILTPKSQPPIPSDPLDASSYVLVRLPDDPIPEANPKTHDDDDPHHKQQQQQEEEAREEQAEAEAEAELADPLREFELKCPPGGDDAVILYATSLRGIRKTFEDCGRVRLLLENLRVAFHERDVSMDLGYKDELWGVLGSRVTPPRLFVKGRYVGGAEEVIGLHEQGKLIPLLRRAAPEDGGGGRGGGGLCAGCGGARFVVCTKCSGSRKVFDEERGVPIRCANCNENGLVACPLCS